MNLIKELRDGNAGVSGALFSTYTFSAEYFEQMVLNKISDRGADSTVVVYTDATTYQSTLEDDSERIGSDYQLAPISVPNRTYHPKLCFFAGSDYVEGFVGSTNLTQRGLNSNRELLTHVRCDREEVDALRDAIDTGSDSLGESHRNISRRLRVLLGIHRFYSRLLERKRIGRVARIRTKEVLDAAEWIKSAETTLSDSDEQTATSQVIHNLDIPLWKQVESLIRADETVQRTEIAVPYYGQTLDFPKQVADRSEELTLWLQRGEASINSSQLASLLDRDNVSATVYNGSRFVHGKWLRLETDAAVYSLMGSPNASRSAMLETATIQSDESSATGNIEVGLLQRSPTTSAFENVMETSEFDNVEVWEDDLSESAFRDPGSPQSGNVTEESLRVNSISFRPDITNSAGVLEVSIERRSDLPSDPNAVCVLLELDEREDIEIPLRSIDAEEIEDIKTKEDWIPEVYRRKLHRQEWVGQLTGSGTARFRWGDQITSSRWIEYDVVESDDDRASRAADDVGANAVISNLSRLISGDQESTEQALASLQGVIASLDALSGRPIHNEGQPWPNHGSSPKNNEQQNTSEKSSVTPTATHTSWSGSKNNDDVASLVESFISGWSGDVTGYRDQLVLSRNLEDGISPDAVSLTNHNIAVTKHLSRRLDALNTVTPFLDALNEYARRQSNTDVSLADVIRELPNRYHNLYFAETKVSGGESFLDSQLWSYLDSAQRIVNDENCESDRFYTALHDTIGSTLVVAAIICESQLDYYEPLTGDSTSWPLAIQYLMTLPEAAPPNVDQSLAKWGVAQTQAAMEPVRVTIDESGIKRLRRHITNSLQSESDTTRTVAGFYARVALLGITKTDAWQSVSLAPETVEAMRTIRDQKPESIPDVAEDVWGL